MKPDHTSLAGDEPAPGVRCPDCHCGHCPVYRTTRRALTVNGRRVGAITRQRTCRHCGRRFVTTERVAAA